MVPRVVVVVCTDWPGLDRRHSRTCARHRRPRRCWVSARWRGIAARNPADAGTGDERVLAECPVLACACLRHGFQHRAAHGKRQGQVFIPDSGGAQRGQAVGSFPCAPSSVAFRHSIRICTGQGLWMGFRPVGDCPQMAWMSLWKSCSHPARGQAARSLWRFDHLMSNGISERIRPVGYRPQFPWTVLCTSCG